MTDAEYQAHERMTDNQLRFHVIWELHGAYGEAGRPQGDAFVRWVEERYEALGIVVRGEDDVQPDLVV